MYSLKTTIVSPSSLYFSLLFDDKVKKKSAKRGSYSLSNCMYFAIHNMTCVYVTILKFGHLNYTPPNIALFMVVMLRQWIKHMMSYDSLNLEIWKGYKTPFRRSGHKYRLAGETKTTTRYSLQTLSCYPILQPI